jgi:hypothetical protein
MKSLYQGSFFCIRLIEGPMNQKYLLVDRMSKEHPCVIVA